MIRRKTFLIIDANSVVHRAYHALPNLSDQTGSPAQAVYGFALAFIHITKTLNPDYAVACFDTKNQPFATNNSTNTKFNGLQRLLTLLSNFQKLLICCPGSVCRFLCKKAMKQMI